MIVVVDYGVNNLRSVVRAIAAGGHTATLTADPALVRRADRVLVPGVGHFGQASKNLTTSGLGPAIQEVAASGRPVMGICLGMQLFFRRSEEAPEGEGLGLLDGKVQRLRTSLPIPHVGWAEVKLTPQGTRHPMLGELFHGESQFFYHVHSYHPAELAPESMLGTAEYGGAFATIVGRANVIGVQFHPEKSQKVGIELLARFVAWSP
ncbi:MAG TPA: imidazole glycerol phosphate synthase subunit HisH [Gemmatimonadales bacterium]|nr:imidazole glycerol phosphate synthase subunit HisH [Gemmatimonadales bacterium]